MLLTKKMAVLILLFIFPVLASPVKNNITRPDTVRVLFIGSSYTGYHSLTGLFLNIAKKAGKPIIVKTRLMYGQYLDEIVEYSGTSAAIKMMKWNYIILQDGCHNAAYPKTHASLIPSSGYHPLKPILQKYYNMAKNNYSATRIVYFMPWAFKDGMTWIKGQTDTYEDMQIKIFNNTLDLLEELDIWTAPVGLAWYRVIQEKPYIELFEPDMSHQSPEGSYLSACVFFSTLFAESCVGNPYTGKIADSTALYFQKIASAVVMDSLQTWRPKRQTAIQRADISSPDQLMLHPNFPNPFNNATTLFFDLSRSMDVSLHVYNTPGQLLATLFSGFLTAGPHRFIWNPQDVPSGVYFITLSADGNYRTIKTILIR
ncbi:T9SS type A sorting domain-containing protein [candidate division KSB1 bacterium]|nr:T9SS type A sorting domain-containing protein [candidate division KSB1 bacterium]